MHSWLCVQGSSACGQPGANTAVSSHGRSRLRPDSSLPQLFPLRNYLPSCLWALRTATLPPAFLLTLSVPQKC